MKASPDEAGLGGKADPCAVARKIRALQTQPNLRSARIPLTRRDMEAMLQSNGSHISAFEAIQAVEHDAGCAFEAAQAAVEEVIPELFADFWRDVWK